MELTNITKEPGIYCIESISNGKKYIGSAVSLRKRVRQHFSDLKSSRHSNRILQNHYNKYGEDDLVFSIIEECEKESLISREQFYIDTINPEFNICKIAGSSLGIKRSDEFKKNMRIVHTNPSDETRKKMSISQTGKVMSDETKRRIGEAHTGSLHGMYGVLGEYCTTSKRVLCTDTGMVFGSAREAQRIMFS